MSNARDPEFSPQALNRAMLEAVDFVHSEGWDAPPTLFAVVPTRLLVDELDALDEDTAAPLTLIVQDNLPDNLSAGSEALADYVSRIAWPEGVAGAILAQEIRFRDAGEGPDAAARPARLFSGVLRPEGVDLTLLQLRPTEEELAAGGAFAEDQIELRGGPDVAPGILAALRYGLDQDPEELV
ncbi:PPA1309 family protein [Corynebacterium guangdongense]|uniref:Uncharacterized protein n=1 Tax=Corynebacterium guangdongense TaxID=1783348 RepID=A0ABU1ZVB6_9CORY|nr:PPA1309 family protein [Corynebacterium guangdongense]MDR7328730.1 hypothetical protein [Corynebacterium guangdongense]WJZ17307.1 hypothetical protein CGUA_03555 [Corynebacterium guangdongense]